MKYTYFDIPKLPSAERAFLWVSIGFLVGLALLIAWFAVGA